MRQSKIVVTIGPATQSREMIDLLVQRGVDAFRLNCSHGKLEDHQKVYETIREFETLYRRPLSVILDLQGPKLRIGVFEEGRITLKQGKRFTLDQNPAPGNVHRVHLPHPQIFDAIQEHHILLLDDGKIKLKVIEKSPSSLHLEVLVGGVLSNKKGVNSPDTHLPIDILTQKDIEDLEFGLSLGVDWVALSFVQSLDDVLLAKQMINYRARIISKIEKPQALNDLHPIIQHSDAIMIARGDLGVELPPEDVPVIQRQIIHACHTYGVPVIVATQMLESMIHAPTPTRAEASDVATAVFEGADAVMLSAETAVGQYPIEAVEIMDKIIKSSEHHQLFQPAILPFSSTAATLCDAIVQGMHTISTALPLKYVVVYSMSGYTALRMASSRPKTSIIALTTSEKTYRALSLVWGIKAYLNHEIYSFQQMTESACTLLKEEKLVDAHDQIALIAGVPFGVSGGGNIIHLVSIRE